MRFELSEKGSSRLSPLIKPDTTCGCEDETGLDMVVDKIPDPPYITGSIECAAGTIPVVSTVLSRRDKWETVKARIGSFRMNYSVKPGLYAAGKPGAESHVFVTANYKMSFDALRSAINGIDAWILVLDTKGINVWCAAGKGTFGTVELLHRIRLSHLPEVVAHRKLIVPQLGAPGVSAAEVRRRSGFSVIYGPVRAGDIGAFAANGYKCDRDMRTVKFTILDRLILTPIEVRMVMVKFLWFLAAVLVIFGLTPQGIIFRDAVFKGAFFIISGLVAVFAGAFFTPVFLPFIPFRSFALKGWIAGAVLYAPLLYLMSMNWGVGTPLVVSAAILFPLVSSYLALQFTGASTYTNLSGVKKEIRLTLPVYVGGGVLSFILLVLYKAADWGFL